MIKKTNHYVCNAHLTIRVWIVAFFVFNSIMIIAQTNQTNSPWDGRTVFNEKGCINCHPINGVGGKGGPDLRKDVFYGTYLELASLMWNHYPKMAKKMVKMGKDYPKLTESEMSLLVTYLSYQRYLGEPGSEFTGRKLLENKGCFSCHKFGGKGSDIGPDISQKDIHLSPLALAECMWNHGPDMMGIFEQYDIERPQFYGNDIANLASGIRSYMPPSRSAPVDLYDMGDSIIGKKLISKKGCLHCHSIRGEGSDLASDFAETSLDYSVTQIAGAMWNHGPEMWDLMKSEGISIPQFNKGEMADIIAYLYFLNFEDKPGDSQIGYEILEEKQCFSCHTTIRGNEKVLLLTPEDHIQDSPMAMIAAMWNHAPAMEKKIKELPWGERISWPKLSPEEMTNIYAYFKSLPPLESESP